jgi:dTDP-4-amino-4,6-dideoxygalactose transaminase
MKMKFIPVAKPTVGKKEADLVYKQIKSGWFSMGKKVLEFEKKVSKYLNVKYAVAMNNGTSALDSLLTALEIEPNDEVIVPSLTYISTANVVSYKRAKLVLCDSDEKTFNVDHKSLLKKITKKTKLIIVTDMKGMPIDYDFFVKLSKKTKINIIADSAESFGAKYKKKFVGSQLLAHTFSFFANKNITTGEGGMVVTNNKILKDKLKIIRNQGQNKRYNHIVLGNNYRMTDINASIGIEQLKKLKKTIVEKERVSKKYNKIFMNVKEVKTPYIPSYVSQHSWYNYTIKVPSNIRDSLVKFLYKKNVETRLSFPPVHIQPYYKKKYKYKNNSFKKSFKTYSEFIDLPIWANLSQKQILYIGNIIINFLKKK